MSIPSQSASAYGYVFVDSQLTADPQVKGQVLARIDVSQRAAGSTQISATQAASLRDPTVVLSGWQPQ